MIYIVFKQLNSIGFATKKSIKESTVVGIYRSSTEAFAMCNYLSDEQIDDKYMYWIEEYDKTPRIVIDPVHE